MRNTIVVFSSSIYQVVLVTMFAKHCGQEHMLRAPSWRIRFHEPESCLLFMWVKLHNDVESFLSSQLRIELVFQIMSNKL